MNIITRHSFLALFLLAAVRAKSGSADAESSMRAAVAAQTAAPQPPSAPATPPAAPMLAAATFGPVMERDSGFGLINTSSIVEAEYLELRSGKFVNQAPPGDIGALRSEGLPAIRHGINLTTVAVAPNRWNATPAEVLAELAQATPQQDVRLQPSNDVFGRQTYFFKTRDGTAGTLQLVQMQLAAIIRVRYKLLQPTPAVSALAAPAAGAQSVFGPVIERVVAFNGNESCYDLDTGKFVNLSDNDVINEQKVRAAGVDLYFSPISNDLNRLAALDVLLVPLDDKAWTNATPGTVRDAIARLQKEPVPLTYGSAPVVRGTYAFALVKGRAGRGETTVGVLQVFGAVGTGAKTFNGVGIRYKMVQNGSEK